MFPFLKQNLLKSDLIHYEMKIGKTMKKCEFCISVTGQLFLTDTMKSSHGQYGPCGIGGLILETYKSVTFSVQLSFFDRRSGQKSEFSLFMYPDIYLRNSVPDAFQKTRAEK